MIIAVLCTDPMHAVIPTLKSWVAAISAQGHIATLHHDRAELVGGDVLFLVSCSQVIRESERSQFKATLVLHASDLPKGRGWSPHVWEIVRGGSTITLSLFSASDSVDTGDVWFKSSFVLEGHELLPEINARLFEMEARLMTDAVDAFDRISPVPQSGEPGPYLRRRTPADSELDPHKSIADQFDLLRVVDNERYPAYFFYRGHRYSLRIERDERL